MVHIVAISSSLRKASCNTGLLRALARNAPAGVTFDIITPDLPLFNQDIESPEKLPQSVFDFRKRVQAADAFVIGTSEYNFSISGALKNAFDWASRGPNGNLLNDKAAALVGAAGGSGSLRAQNHVRDISLGLNLHVMGGIPTQIQIFKNPSPFDLNTGELVDPVEEENAKKTVLGLLEWTKRLAVKK